MQKYRYNFSILTKKLKQISFSTDLKYEVDGIPKDKVEEFLDDLGDKITIDKEQLLKRLSQDDSNDYEQDEDETKSEDTNDDETLEEDDLDLDESEDNEDEEETEDDGKIDYTIIGNNHCMAILHKNEETDNIVIDVLYVEQSYRHKGVALELIDAIKDYAGDSEIGIVVDRDENPEGYSFYLHNGFEEYKKQGSESLMKLI